MKASTENAEAYQLYLKGAKATTVDGAMIPHAVSAFSCATHLLESTGHAAESNTAIRRALTIDPLSTGLNAELGCNAYYQRRYDEAIRGYRDALASGPGNVVAFWGLGKALDQQKRYDEALGELGKAAKTGEPAPPIIVAEMGCAYAGAGRPAEARRTLDTLAAMSKQTFVDPYLVATIYAALDDKTQTFAWLEKAYDARSGMLVALASEPKWDPVRSDPRFHDLEKRVGF